MKFRKLSPIIIILFISISALTPVFALSETYYLDNWDIQAFAGAQEYAIGTANETNAFTYTINCANVKTTNATGDHTYKFYMGVTDGQTVEEWAILLTGLNGTDNGVSVTLDESPAYENAEANVTKASMILNEGVLSIYEDSDKVWEYAVGGNVTTIGWYTNDNPAGTSYPSDFEGYFIVKYTTSGEYSGTTIVDTQLLMTVAIIGAVLAMVGGLSKKAF